MLCRGPLALGKGPETLGKGFVEGCPRQRPIGEFLDGEGVFAEGPLSGTRQSLCRGPGRPSAKKRGRQAPAPLAVSLPRADPRQRNGFFFGICLPRADPRQINFFIFFKNLCRGPPPWPSAKKFSGFFKNSLPRAGPRQSRQIIFLFLFFKTFAEGLLPGPWQRNF